MKKTGLFLFIILSALTASSCGRLYDCNVAGYARDTENDNGINGVRIRFYEKEPQDINAPGYMVETSTMSSGGNAGYFSGKFLWYNLFGTYGDEGDTGEIWITAYHDDYTSVIVQRTGLLSDTSNVIADITMARASFEATELRGRVVNVSGDGVNNVRVVLDLESTIDDNSDYIAITGEDDGIDGVFVFSNVRWRDDTPDSENADTENCGIYIDDTDYNSTYDENNMYSAILTSDDSTPLSNSIQVTRVPRTEFSANISGLCQYWLTNTAGDREEIGISGVEVTLTYTDDAGSHTLYDVTGGNGSYNFSIDWTEAVDGAEDAGYVIPEGEDVILVSLTFTSSTATGNMYSFSSITNAEIKSWLNPNTMPARIDLDNES